MAASMADSSKRQVLGVFMKIRIGGRLHPVGPLSQIDEVEIHIEYLFFRIGAFDLDRQYRFFDLSLDGFLRCEIEIAGQVAV